MDGVGPTVVLAGHAGCARGLLEAAELIVGRQPGVHALGLEPEQDPSELVAAARDAAPEGEVLVLADLLGGSPANALAASFLSDPRARLVTGLNLPMLLEVLTARPSTVDALARTAVKAGAEGVVELGGAG